MALVMTHARRSAASLQGKKPNVYHKKFQIVPVETDDEYTVTAPIDEHIEHNSFY